MRVPVAVLGASGYTGAELLRLLLDHPRVEIAALAAERAAGSRIDRVFPHLAGRLDLPIEAFDAERIAARAEIVFSCLPHGASAAAVAALAARGALVVDLSADFRLRDGAVFAEWYGAHPHPELLPRAVYGLPEFHREALRGARLIASPGCYPTATILAAAPLLARGLVKPRLVVDAKSGVSGAGRSPSQATHFAEAGEGVRPYKVAGAHRHTPEMEQELSRAAGGAVRLTFTPHLVPMTRGILACVYGEPTDPALSEADVRAALVDAYRGEPFITVLDEGLPDTAHVRGSNRAHVAVRLDTRAGVVVAMAAIDNLVKGASGQAIQAMNIARGWPETDGLAGAGVFP
ncbi:MAG TPA: N-acetyl-gamma-glutamyl-phosphate reductase [Kofleriaceae bacterium]